MAIVVVRYTQEATNQMYILAQDADGDTNTPHRAFEDYLVDGWTTEILAYHPRTSALRYHDYDHFARQEDNAHGAYRWD